MLDMIKESADEHMKKAVEALEHNFASIRTGRASAMLLDRIKVDYYGVPTPVNQMAAVKTPDASRHRTCDSCFRSGSDALE